MSAYEHKHSFYRELGKLIQAGIGVRESAQTILDTRPHEDVQIRAQSILEGLNDGQSITDSLSQHITSLEQGILRAGEKGGRIPESLHHLADYFQLLQSTRSAIIQSLIYPLVLLHMGLIVGSIPSDFMMGNASMSDFISNLLRNAIITYGIIIVGYYTVRNFLKSSQTESGPDNFFNRIPVIKKARKSMAMARFCKVYHIGLLSGLPITEVIKLSINASQSGSIRKAGDTLLETAISGQPLGPAFMNESVFLPAFSRGYVTAETSGSLDEELQRWAMLFTEEAQTAYRHLQVFLPKILYALIVLFVIFTILRIYSGYFDMLESIID